MSDVDRSVPPWICTVRGCGERLVPRERSLACARGHSFDLARSGYLNLLQPQHRRSLAAGDARETVDARLRLAAAGVGRELVAALVELARELGIGADAWILEIGCGPGAALAELAAATGARAIGLDLSVHAIDAAARRHTECAWIVANADHGIPIATGALDLALSIAAPKPPAELARVLGVRRHALICVPGEGDLAELRAALLPHAEPIERAERVLADFAPSFELVSRKRVAAQHVFDAQGIADLSLATYRGARKREAERAAELTTLAVTLETEILLFARR